MKKGGGNGWLLSDSTRVCPDHFITGSPSDLYDQYSSDWAPNLNLGHKEVNRSDSHRYDQKIEREGG